MKMLNSQFQFTFSVTDLNNVGINIVFNDFSLSS